MTRKIFRTVFLVAIAVFLSCLALTMGVLSSYYNTLQETQLRSELTLAASAVENGGSEYLESLHGGDRLTWIASDGEVLFDSLVEADNMENHADRTEVVSAFETGFGESRRYSATLTEETLYYAQRLSDGTVLRISASRYTVLTLVMAMMQPLILIILAAFALSAVLANMLTKKIVRPLEAIDLERPLEGDCYDELAPMLTRLEQQHREIRRQHEELSDRKNEFLAVIGNMNEGLILLGTGDVVLSINKAAMAFLGADSDPTGSELMRLDRSRELNCLIQDAKNKGKSELELGRNGREYRINAAAVSSGGKVSGVVLSIFDVTEKLFAEQQRRQFSANVSHELKTPLQSIMGSAELISNSLVKPEDMAHFGERIHAEAARLLTLIEDIIRLSQLDEKSELRFEAVDLYYTAAEELAHFDEAARARNIKLSLEGEPCLIRGVKELVHEVIYNLLDNAVKYNVDGGNVSIKVSRCGKSASLLVSDTGIGIPHEAQSHVFERFYRVDKSRSKQIGGTGLGLSIVKHAVNAMNGTIELRSAPDKGTTVTVALPLADASEYEN